MCVVCMHLCAHAYGGQKKIFSVLPQECHVSSFEVGSHIGLELDNRVKLPC